MRMLREARGCEQKSILLGQICRDANETTRYLAWTYDAVRGVFRKKCQRRVKN